MSKLKGQYKNKKGSHLDLSTVISVRHLSHLHNLQFRVKDQQHYHLEICFSVEKTYGRARADKAICKALHLRVHSHTNIRGRMACIVGLLVSPGNFRPLCHDTTRFYHRRHLNYFGAVCCCTTVFPLA